MLRHAWRHEKNYSLNLRWSFPFKNIGRFLLSTFMLTCVSRSTYTDSFKFHLYVLIGEKILSTVHRNKTIRDL